MRIEVRTPCNPTEDARKVERAMKNVFPDLDIRKEAGFLIGTGTSAERFGELLKNQRIRSAARAVFLSSRSGNEVSFTLNKQVAFIGKVSFGSGSPLGDIEVKMTDKDIEAFIDSIAPRIGDVGE
ncbi:MAG: hypothetical protein KAW84_02590 [Thermoplasmata archaeon]|nr:hypothetical protein [Thermoplasmata archaeon]